MSGVLKCHGIGGVTECVRIVKCYNLNPIMIVVPYIVFDEDK